MYVKSLKNNKSPGIDGIKPILLKNMTKVFFNYLSCCGLALSKVYNWCLQNGYFPNKFKHAKVIPILKQGKEAKLATSYRPISMLNTIDKILEKVILKRLLEFTNDNQIINKEQFGFREGHSTVHQKKELPTLS